MVIIPRGTAIMRPLCVSINSELRFFAATRILPFTYTVKLTTSAAKRIQPIMDRPQGYGQTTRGSTRPTGRHASYGTASSRSCQTRVSPLRRSLALSVTSRQRRPVSVQRVASVLAVPLQLGVSAADRDAPLMTAVLVARQSQSRLRLEGRARTLSGPSPDLTPSQVQGSRSCEAPPLKTSLRPRLRSPRYLP
jgi:hypothetical protein